MLKLKAYNAKNDYDASVECTACGIAIHQNLIVFVSKEKIRCPKCSTIFKPKQRDLR